MDIMNNADGSVEVVDPSSPSLLSYLQQMPNEPTAPENNIPNSANPRERKTRRVGTPRLGTRRVGTPSRIGRISTPRFPRLRNPFSQKSINNNDDDLFDKRLNDYIENEQYNYVNTHEEEEEEDEINNTAVDFDHTGDIDECIYNARLEYEDVTFDDWAEIQDWEDITDENVLDHEKVITPDDAENIDTMFAAKDGTFLQRYNDLLEVFQRGELDDGSMRMFIALLIQYANEMEAKIKSGEYHSNNKKKQRKLQKQLEKDFNKKRQEIIDTLKVHLPPKLHHLINMFNKFTTDMEILFFKHYAPVGCRHADDDINDYCRDDQCCMATMKSKLYNFLYNEHKGEDMEDYKFGGKKNKDQSHKMVTVDLICFLLDKFDKEVDMEKQYEDYASLLQLDSYYELMAISYTLARLHLLLYRVCHPGKTCQLHCASSATAKFILGFGRGPSKYLALIKYRWYNVTLGPHAQVYLMGLCKSLRMFPHGVREVIAKHLVDVYSNVIEFNPGFKTQLMNIFGGEYAEGIELGKYNRLALLLENSGLLNIDNLEMVDEDAKPAATAASSSDHLINKDEDDVGPTTFDDTKSSATSTPDVVQKQAASNFISILSTKQWDPVDIEFLAVELETITVEVLMRRMRKCRAGTKLQRIAADMPDDCSTSSELKARIEEVALVLKRNYKSVVRSIKRIKKNQERGGQRLSLLSNLASKHNNNETISPKELRKLVKLLAPGRNESDANNIIVVTAEAQREWQRNRSPFYGNTRKAILFVSKIPVSEISTKTYDEINTILSTPSLFSEKKTLTYTKTDMWKLFWKKMEAKESDEKCRRLRAIGRNILEREKRINLLNDILNIPKERRVDNEWNILMKSFKALRKIPADERIPSELECLKRMIKIYYQPLQPTAAGERVTRAIPLQMIETQFTEITLGNHQLLHLYRSDGSAVTMIKILVSAQGHCMYVLPAQSATSTTVNGTIMQFLGQLDEVSIAPDSNE